MASSDLHDFQSDLGDPRVSEAESLVAAALQRMRPRDVVDCRDEHTSRDFRVRFSAAGGWKTFDVKFDRYMDRTDRIAFESHNEYDDGRCRDTWGRNETLDYLAVVGESRAFARIFGMRRFREFMDETAPGDDWRRIRARNRGYVTCGWAVPFRELKRNGVYVFDPPLRPADTLRAA